jgi:Tol biopolymer transport system component
MSLRPVVLVVTAFLVTPLLAQDPLQVTNGNGEDSRVALVGPVGSPYVLIHSTADLTPSAPGNADASSEVFLYDTRSGAITQVTDWRGDPTYSSTAKMFLKDGAIVISSRADLTPGSPGHVVGTTAGYLYRPAGALTPATLVQVTPSSGVDVNFRGTYRGDRVLVFDSTGDLVTGGNTDASDELYAYDRDTKKLTQLTRGTGNSSFQGLCDHGRRAVVTSTSDLTGTGTNLDGSVELFLVDLTTLAVQQVTSNTDASFISVSVIDAPGRRIAFSTDGNLGTSPGNADGSTEAYVYDIVAKKLQQVTSSNYDSTIQDFVAGSNLVVVSSQADFVPQTPTTPGNADHSVELFTFDLRTLAVLQRTASLGDCTYRMPPRGHGKPAIITSNGDLAPGKPGNPMARRQLYFLNLGPKLSPLVQLTAGDRDSNFGALDDSGRFLAITSNADLILGENQSHAAQVFIDDLVTNAPLRQMPSNTGSTFKGFLHDGRSLVIESRGEFTPLTPKNADGSREVFRLFYR